MCDACDVLEDTEHYICHCAKYQTARSQTLGPVPSVSVLQECPDDVVRFIRRTGLLRESR